MTDPDREQHARIENLVNSEPTVSRTAGQKVLRLASAVCAVITLAAVGVLVIAYVHLRNCTNASFGDPAGLQHSAQVAQVAFAKSTKAFAAAASAVFATQPGSTAQNNAVIVLKVDAQAWRDAAKAWQAATGRAFAYREEHPTGEC